MTERCTHTCIPNDTTSLFAVRCARCRHRGGNRKVLQTPPSDRVSRLPQADRRRDAGRPGCAPRDGQLCHAQDAEDQGLAGVPSSTGMSTSRRHRPHGSTRSNAGSPNSRASNFSAAPTGPPPNLKPTSSPPPRRTTKTPSPTTGPNLPTRSSPPSDASARKQRGELQIQVTSDREGKSDGACRRVADHKLGKAGRDNLSRAPDGRKARTNKIQAAAFAREWACRFACNKLCDDDVAERDPGELRYRAGLAVLSRTISSNDNIFRYISSPTRRL